MSYATTNELRGRIGSAIFDEIYGIDNFISEASVPDAEADLEAAAAEIDGSIAIRYQLPVSGNRSIALLRDWCLTLAEEHAFARPAGNDFAEKVKSRVAQVRKYLDEIRLGQFRLPDAPENQSGRSRIALVQCEQPHFSREKIRGF